MTDLVAHPSGAYSFLPGSAAFSLGAVAAAGWAIDELRPAAPSPMHVGLARLVDVLAARGLTPDAVVGLELRSPEAVDAESFAAFNVEYLQVLDANGLVTGPDNPVTRTNAVPDSGGPSVPSLVAAQVMRPDPGGSGGDFVLSGVAELLPDGTAVAAGDTSEVGLLAKASHVLAALADRRAALGAGRANVVNVYCSPALGPLYDQVMTGVTTCEGASLRHWRCVPPLVGLAFEVDCRRLSGWERIDG